jgi:hypothetical protein
VEPEYSVDDATDTSRLAACGSANDEFSLCSASELARLLGLSSDILPSWA